MYAIFSKGSEKTVYCLQFFRSVNALVSRPNQLDDDQLCDVERLWNTISTLWSWTELRLIHSHSMQNVHRSILQLSWCLIPADSGLLSKYSLSRRCQKLGTLWNILRVSLRGVFYYDAYEGPDDITKTIIELVALIPDTAEFQNEAYSFGACRVSDGVCLHESDRVPEFIASDQDSVRSQFEMFSMFSSLLGCVAEQAKDLIDLIIDPSRIELRSTTDHRAFAILHICERLIGAGCKQGPTILSALLWVGLSVTKSIYPACNFP
jgi:hypothetical protein